MDVVAAEGACPGCEMLAHSRLGCGLQLSALDFKYIKAEAVRDLQLRCSPAKYQCALRPEA